MANRYRVLVTDITQVWLEVEGTDADDAMTRALLQAN